MPERIIDYVFKFPSLFGLQIDERKEFLENHFHTGILYMDNYSAELFKVFFNVNKKKIIKNYSLSKFPEQELVKIFQILNGELSFENAWLKYESSLVHFSEGCYYVHMDHSMKHNIFLFENFRNEDFEYKGLSHDSVNEVKKVQEIIWDFLTS